MANESSVQLLRRATGLDIGESEAIILSDQIKADLLLMDEVKGRQVAKNMGINIMGTIGILVQAYESRLLSKGQIEECIEVLRDNGRHISDRLYEQLLDRINNKI